VAADKANIWYRFLLADLYQQNQQVGDAVEVYKGIVDGWPDRYEVYFDLANSLAFTGKVSEAQKVYTDLEKRIGLNEELIMQQYGMLANSGKLDEAEQLALRAVAAFPGEPQYIGLLAELYDQRGDHDKALAQYQKAWSWTPVTVCCASALRSTIMPRAAWTRPMTNSGRHSWIRSSTSTPRCKC
jgi:tetratricopeptide (TPR) repeat protein